MFLYRLHSLDWTRPTFFVSKYGHLCYTRKVREETSRVHMLFKDDGADILSPTCCIFVAADAGYAGWALDEVRIRPTSEPCNLPVEASVPTDQMMSAAASRRLVGAIFPSAIHDLFAKAIAFLCCLEIRCCQSPLIIHWSDEIEKQWHQLLLSWVAQLFAWKI